MGGNNAPPLLQFHGDQDSLLPHTYGETTYKLLKNFGVNAKFISLPGVEHELTKLEIHKFKDWITQILPETL